MYIKEAAHYTHSHEEHHGSLYTAPSWTSLLMIIFRDFSTISFAEAPPLPEDCVREGEGAGRARAVFEKDVSKCLDSCKIRCVTHKVVSVCCLSASKGYTVLHQTAIICYSLLLHCTILHHGRRHCWSESFAWPFTRSAVFFSERSSATWWSK